MLLQVKLTPNFIIDSVEKLKNLDVEGLKDFNKYLMFLKSNLEQNSPLKVHKLRYPGCHQHLPLLTKTQ